jgi:hypothetical protein
VGGFADFVISRQDPRGDVLGALDAMEAVVVAGRLYYRAELEALLEAERAAKDDGDLVTSFMQSKVGGLLQGALSIFSGGAP